ncbi:MAG TPA: aldo/keto reductase [Abditibacteriaceae bacterium]|jgi:aryl-alcohol dehydrogenase-like predicted oxidoreductase
MSSVLSPTRFLGSTGVQVPLIGYGTAPLGKEKHATRELAVRCLNRAIDKGITYLDTSPDYGSESHVGEVMRTRRDEVFLATKINRRSREGVLDELKESLDRLQTDHVDLIQVHAINAWADLEQALAPDGALAALEQARDEGLVRFIGITGHARPEILGHALTQYPFDTVLVALGMVDRLVSSPETFTLPQAVERNVGVIAMKVFGHGAIENRELALRYSLGLPGVSLAIIGLDNEQHIDEIVELAQNVESLSDAERDQLIDEVRPVVEKDSKESQEGESKLFWLHDTTVMGWKQHDEPVLVRY